MTAPDGIERRRGVDVQAFRALKRIVIPGLLLLLWLAVAL